jgi:protein-disulfide isomerase
VRGLLTATGGLLVFVLGVPLGAQVQTDDLKQELESQRELLKEIQRDIQEIKESLARRTERRSPVNAVVDPGASHFRGEPTAGLTLIEFSDYQCPFCARYVHDTYPQIETEYIQTGKLKSVFVDLPLESLHKLAFMAAETTHCADEQGKYWPMHDRLFANQRALEPWNAHAQALSLDVAAFEQCMTSHRPADKIKARMAVANEIGLTVTPTFLLGRTDPNSSKIRVAVAIQGAKPFIAFKEEIDKLLAEAQGPPAAGAAR